MHCISLLIEGNSLLSTSESSWLHSC